MRSHAKAPTAGSTQRQAAGLGRIRFAPTAVLAVAIASLLAFAATPASAASARPYESSFGSFVGSNPQALAVDQSGGDVYAIDTENGAVARFTAAGAPDNFSAGPDAGTNTLTGFAFDSPSAAQVAVDSSGGATDGDIYVADSFGGGIKVFANDGTPLATLDGSTNFNGFFSEPCGVAVDQSSGDVYVGDYGVGVWRYTPSGDDVANADYSGGISTAFAPCQLAADSGEVYAVQWNNGPLFKFAASDFATGEPPSPSPTQITSPATAIATDPSSGDVYVDKGAQISVFDSSGASLYSFGSSAEFESSRGVAVREGGNAYVADASANQIDVFGAPLPTSTTEPATQVHHTHAVLNGHLTLNGASDVTDCHFEWGADTSYGNSVPCAQGNSFSSAADVSAEITGLTPGATYHFRLDISNADGEVNGEDESLTATPVAPTRPVVAIFGPDGTSGSVFNGNDQLAFRQSADRLYALDEGGIYGFDASAPPAFSTLAGFAPLATALTSGDPGLAVDDTALGSAGNIYFVAEIGGLVHGFDSTGAALGGNFPIDPETNPGAPAGSPQDICGAAVDSSGTLWVANYKAERVLEYSSAGVFLGSIDTSAQGHPCRLAFDTNDDLYVGLFEEATWRYTAASGYAAATQIDPGDPKALAVDPSTHDLYVAHAQNVSEYDSTGTLIDEFATGVAGAKFKGIAVDETNHYVYVSDKGNHEIRVYGPAAILPEVTTGSASAVSATSAVLNGMAGANGVALTDCHFEYVADQAFLGGGFSDLSSGGSVPCDQAPGSIPTDFEEHPVSATVTGLDPTVLYHFRLVVANAEAGVSGQPALIPGEPLVETTGSPTRTAFTARLDSRLDPHGVATTYRFEYGDQGPCDSNPCTATSSHPAGSGEEFEFVSQRIEGLKADTTYHYRLVADNGNSGGPAFGADMTIATRASDAALSHGHLPGPPGSDRAWEQVNAPDTGGNPVRKIQAISDDGNRAVYSIAGGNPGSQVGSLNNQLFAERTPSGWQSSLIYPTRDQAPGAVWFPPGGRSDLSRLFAVNIDNVGSDGVSAWQLSPGSPARHVFSVPYAGYGDFNAVSDDGSRLILRLEGSFDPDHPVTATEVGRKANLYDVTSGTPHLISLLPDGSVPDCGVEGQGEAIRSKHWVSADGSHFFFYSEGNAPCGGKQLYVRDLEAETTSLISAGGEPQFIRSTAAAAFFTTKSSLVPEDEGGKDVYRYDLEDESLDCVTCFSGLVADVESAEGRNVAVSDDGSRVYFKSPHRLLPGASAQGIYRVDVAGGDLAFVAPGADVLPGDNASSGNAISPDGSVFIFRSADTALDSVNGPRNGGTGQYYRYDDNDRSLVCVSCPTDGAPPRGKVPFSLLTSTFETGPNQAAPLTSAGDFAFGTPTPLVSADQNTAGPGQNATVGEDVYEWRDGRLLLVTDGLASSQPLEGGPAVAGITPSGRDIFFVQRAQLTPDAIDAYTRLYDARIGGGFEFPPPPPPCPLEACQGTPKGVPEESRPGSADYSGAGNSASHPVRCRKGKVRQRGRCVAKKHRKQAKKRSQHKANHDRRAGR